MTTPGLGGSSSFTFGAPSPALTAPGKTPAGTSGFAGGFGAPLGTTTGFAGFGAAAAPATTTAATPGFGGFSAATTAAPTAFGQTTTPAATTTGFGGFGTATTAAPTAFGQTATPAATTTGFGGGFGATTTPFGQTTPSAAATGGFSGFGALGSSSTPGGGLNLQTKPLFGQPSTGGFAPTTSTFGTPSSFGAFGAGLQQQQQMQQQMQQMQMTAPQIRPEQVLPLTVKRLQDAYLPNALFFRHVFFNLVNPRDIERYTRPPDFDETLWIQAVTNMTAEERQCMAPVQAVGFGDVAKRVDAQNKQLQLHEAKLRELEAQISAMQQKHSQMMIRLQEVRRKQRQHFQHLLQLIKRIELLRTRGYPVLPDEEVLRVRLETLQRELSRPNQYNRRLQEISALIQMKEADRLSLRESYQVANSQALQQVRDVLSEHQQSLQRLVAIVNQDFEDVQIMKRGLPDSRRGAPNTIGVARTSGTATLF